MYIPTLFHKAQVSKKVVYAGGYTGIYSSLTDEAAVQTY